MSGAIAQAVKDAAQKLAGSLGRDFAGAYKKILHDTADGAEHIAQRTDNNETLLTNLAHDTGDTAAVHGAEHAITTDTEGAVARDAGGFGGHGTIEDPTLRGGSATPVDTAIPEGVRTVCKDPVDVTSGEMIMAQTDLDLPAVLPLVLKRVHLSTYRAGRLFGPSWASTLDQRLELDDEGVCFADEDGVILVYPIPRHDTPVLPAEGARWPLTWHRDGAMTVTDPHAGLTRTFGPLPTTELRNGKATILPISSISDRNGNAIVFDYDDQGTLRQVRHTGGYRISVRTDDGLVICLRLHGDTTAYQTALADDADGLPLVRFAYDGWLDLIEVRNSSGRPTVFTYDRHRITSWTDRNNTTYRYIYDSFGRVARTAGSDGVLSGTLTYDPVRRTTISTDSLGHQTIYRYDEHRHLTGVTDPLGNTTRTTYDRHGRLLEQTDALGRTARFGYDDAGNRVWVEQADGARSTVVFNGLNLPTSVVAPDGGEWEYTYDERGNLLSVTDPTGATTRYTYTATGHVATLTDPLDRTLRLGCDAAGLPIQITDPLGAGRTLTRDGFGRTVAATDPLGGTTRSGWTVEGRIAWRTNELGARERWMYDPENNLVRYQDAAGGTTEIEVGRFDLPVARTGPDGSRHEFAYDTELRLASVTGPLGLTWQYERDPSGNVVSETDFDGRVATYTYDAAGQLTAHTTAAGRTIAFAYDAAGRVVEQRAGGIATSFSYDAAGRLAHAANSDTEVRFERDRLGRILAETVGGKTLRNLYDAAGQRTRRLTPAGVESVWAYDSNGLPAALRGTAGLQFEHDAAGRETARRFGDEISVERAWDAAHRLTAITTVAHPNRARHHDWHAQRILGQQQAYAYRADGYPVALDDDLRGPRRFTLDASGRVTRAAVGVWTGGESVGGIERVPDDHDAPWLEEYAYDPAGSLVAARVTAPGADKETQGPRELAGLLIREAGRLHYEHDGDGRLVRTIRRGLSGQRQTWTYTWNDLNQLVGVVTPDGAVWRYGYDPLGRRITKQRLDEGGAIVEQTDFTWDGMRLAEQTCQPTGETLTWDYEPGGHTPAAQTVSRRLGRDQATVDRAFYAIVTDLVGTPTELLDADGAFAWRASHDLWGNPLRPYPGVVECPLRFPGQYRDPETGWHYNLHRYFNPVTGGYTTPDPLGLTAAPNPLAYGRNPLVWIDPWGLADCLKITDHLWDHVFKGELNKGGSPVGYHFRPGGEDRGYGFGIKTTNLSEVDAHGVYTGTVNKRIWDGNTWVVKRARSSFFPDNWSQEKVTNAITRAIREGKITDAERGTWEGVHQGVKIQGYFDPMTKVVTTAYPVWER